MSLLGDYFRRQVHLDPGHLNRWERRAFGQPTPVWIRDAFLVASGLYFVTATVMFWDQSLFLSLMHGWFAIGFVAMFFDWMFKWLNRLFQGLHARYEALMQVGRRPSTDDSAHFSPGVANDPCCGGPHGYGHVWGRDGPNFVCLKCGTPYRAR